MTTLRQIEANRSNSLYSTGPRSPSGKEQSRKNALKHGVAGAGVVLPDDEAEEIARRRIEWHSSLRPWNAAEEWIADQFVVASVQIERCQHQERTLRDELARRAEESWDDDRRLAAEVLSGGLARDPAKVALQLRQTPQGCDWLIARWEVLDFALKNAARWDTQQLGKALDLLGIAADLRCAPTVLNPTNGEDPRAWVGAVVASEIARLKEAKEALAGTDARERAAAALGLSVEVPRPLSLLRRYEASCQRRMQWALKQLRHGRASTPHVQPTAAPASAATPAPFDARLIQEVREAEDDLKLLDTLEEEIAELKRLGGTMAPAPKPVPDPTPASSSPSSLPDLITDILAEPVPTGTVGPNRRARLAARRRRR